MDKSIPIERWILTDDGKKASQELADSGNFDDVDVLISSDEEKAYLTIKPFADRLKKGIIQIPELGEIKRPNSEKLTLEEYESMKVKIFSDLNYTEHDWETAKHALERFQNSVNKINKKYENKKILICAHGTVLTLYFSSLQNKMDQLLPRWKSLEFGGYGVVKNGKVTKDIVDLNQKK